MTALPIIHRELLVQGRARATYRLRIAVGFAGLVVCAYRMMSASTAGAPGSVGRSALEDIVLVACLFCCGAVFLASDRLSAERREGTLELLFLTPVKIAGVLLGKLVTAALASSCSLLTLLPALMLPMLAGGLELGETARSALALLALLFLALCAGLFCAAGQRGRFWMTRDALLMVVLLFSGPWLRSVLYPGAALTMRGWFSPLALLSAASRVDYIAAPWRFWVLVAGCPSLGLLLLVMAGWRLRRRVGEHTVMASPAKVAAKREEARRALGLYRWEPGKEDAHPISWVVYRQGGVSALIWGLAVIGLVGSRWMVLGLQMTGSVGPAQWVMLSPLAVAGLLVGGCTMASVASRFFANVRRTGELELLLTTPLGAETIVSEQWRVLKRFFVWPVLALQSATMLPLLGAMIAPGSRGGPILLILALLNVANTCLGTAALCWVSLWLGLKARNRAGGLLWSVVLALGLPWSATIFLGPALGDILLFGFYLWLINWSRIQLHRELTGIDTTPAGTSTGEPFSTPQVETATSAQ